MKSKKQKVSALLLSLIFVSASLFSQENPDKKFLFNSDKLTLSTFFVEMASEDGSGLMEAE